MLHVVSQTENGSAQYGSWSDATTIRNDAGDRIGSICTSSDGAISLIDAQGFAVSAALMSITFSYSSNARNGIDCYETISTDASGHLTARIFADALGHVTELIGYSAGNTVDYLFDPAGGLISSRSCSINYNGFNGNDILAAYNVDSYNGGGFFISLDGAVHDSEGWHGGGGSFDDQSGGWGAGAGDDTVGGGFDAEFEAVWAGSGGYGDCGLGDGGAALGDYGGVGNAGISSSGVNNSAFISASADFLALNQAMNSIIASVSDGTRTIIRGL
jgi:hypothetical protein